MEFWAPTHYWFLGPLRGNPPKNCWRFTNGIRLKDTAQIPSHTVPSESFFPWRSFEDYVRCWACIFIFCKSQLCTPPGSLRGKAPEKLPSTQIGKANVFQSHPFFTGQLAGKNFGARWNTWRIIPWVGSSWLGFAFLGLLFYTNKSPFFTAKCACVWVYTCLLVKLLDQEFHQKITCVLLSFP